MIDNKFIFSFIKKEFQTSESFLLFEYIVSLLDNKEEILFQENYENSDYWFHVFIRLCNYYIGHQIFNYSTSINSDKEINIQQYLSEYLITDNLVKKNVLDFLFFKLFVVDIYIPRIAVYYYYKKEKYSFIPDNFFFSENNIEKFLNNCSTFFNLNYLLEDNLSKEFQDKLSVIFNILIDKKIYSDEIFYSLVNNYFFNYNKNHNSFYWKTSYNYLVTFYIYSHLLPYCIFDKIESVVSLSDMYCMLITNKKLPIHKLNTTTDKDGFLLILKNEYPYLYLIFKQVYEEEYITFNIENF